MLRLIWTLQWSLLNVRIWTFNWVWHEHCNGLFNIRNLVSSLILMFVRIFLCDTILYTWFGKKWKRLKKFWGWKICLVYASVFNLSLSMLISFMLIKKRGYFTFSPVCFFFWMFIFIIGIKNLSAYRTFNFFSIFSSIFFSHYFVQSDLIISDYLYINRFLLFFS